MRRWIQLWISNFISDISQDETSIFEYFVFACELKPKDIVDCWFFKFTQRTLVRLVFQVNLLLYTKRKRDTRIQGEEKGL